MLFDIKTFPDEQQDPLQEFVKEIAFAAPVLGFMLWLSALKFFDQ